MTCAARRQDAIVFVLLSQLSKNDKVLKWFFKALAAL